MKTIRHFSLILALFGLILSGCSTLNKSQKGAVIGSAGGAAIGGVIGRTLGNTAMGAIIGATVGGVTGAVIGRKMDQQAEEMKRVLGDAEVRREGEGIVVEFKDRVLFAFNKSDITAQAQANLAKLNDVLKRYPDTNIEIIGHTDSKGTDAHNMTLSQRRATSVAGYLQRNGITSSRVKTRGMGESDPIASNETEEGRASNRRVEFVITANQKMVEDAKREAGQ